MKPLAILCLALLAGLAVPVQAQASERDRQHGQDHNRRSERALSDRAISLDEAVARAERRYDARAVRAEEKQNGDRIEYRIRLLATDGRVFEVRFDAETGEER